MLLGKSLLSFVTLITLLTSNFQWSSPDRMVGRSTFSAYDPRSSSGSGSSENSSSERLTRQSIAQEAPTAGAACEEGCSEEKTIRTRAQCHLTISHYFAWMYVIAWGMKETHRSSPDLLSDVQSGSESEIRSFFPG